MAYCHNCGKSFHACSSCGLNYSWEYNFCSEACWKESDEYKEAISRMERLIRYLPQGGLNDLSFVMGEGDYCGIFEQMIEDARFVKTQKDEDDAGTVHS